MQYHLQREAVSARRQYNSEDLYTITRVRYALMPTAADGLFTPQLLSPIFGGFYSILLGLIIPG